MSILATLLVMTSYLSMEVTAYPGAQCDVTYLIPTDCGEVLGRLTNQVRDNLEDGNGDKM
jgi:hypothetical protein